MRTWLTFFILAAAVFFAACESPEDSFWVKPHDVTGKPVYTTASGLIYIPIETTNEAKPKLGEDVTIQLTVYNKELTETLEHTYGTYKSGIDPLIPGLEEGLALMTNGSVYRFIMAPHLAYNNDTLIFEITLAGISPDPEFWPAISEVKKYLSDNQIAADSIAPGLYISFDEPGIGPPPFPGSTCELAYRGTLFNGEQFDAISATDPFIYVYKVDNVIRGFELAVGYLKEGAKAKVYIPYFYGYGKQGTGSIPAYDPLIFELELLKFTLPEE